MGYNNIYIYLFLVVLGIILVLRIFIPILIYLLPILCIAYLIKIFFGTRSQKQKTTTQRQQSYQQSTYQQTRSSQQDIIDVDYKVVDEEDINTH